MIPELVRDGRPRVEQKSQTIFDLAADKFYYFAAEHMRKRAKRKSRFTNMSVPIDDLIGVRLFSTGSFESTQVEGLTSYLETKDRSGVMLDIGANIGVYSIAFASYFQKIYSFEANPVTFKLFDANLNFSSIGNVQPLNIALSNQAGSGVMYVPRNGNLGWASMVAGHHPEAVDEVVIHRDKLDDVLRKLEVHPSQISLIKMDVEGHELSVLEGARETLSLHQPDILCEVLTSEAGAPVLSFLTDIGYDRFRTFKRVISPWGKCSIVLQDIDPAAAGHTALVLATANTADRGI